MGDAIAEVEVDYRYSRQNTLLAKLKSRNLNLRKDLVFSMPNSSRRWLFLRKRNVIQLSGAVNHDKNIPRPHSVSDVCTLRMCYLSVK